MCMISPTIALKDQREHVNSIKDVKVKGIKIQFIIKWMKNKNGCSRECFKIVGEKIEMY